MQTKSGTLFIVSTPLGNLEDLSLRAAKFLVKVKIIACEDTRRTSLLLNKISELFSFPESSSENVKPLLISFYDQNEIRRTGEILDHLLKGYDVALISDAGSPLISDPGFFLIREAIKKNINIDCLPGPSAVIAGLQLSGLPANNFFFMGFLPDKDERKKKILSDLHQTLLFIGKTKIASPSIILYEAPHRLLSTLNLIHEEFGDISLCVCRELTKLHQEVIRKKISVLISFYQKNQILGEITLVLNTKF